MQPADEKSFNLKLFFSQFFSRNENLREELVEFFDDHEVTVANDQLQMIMGVVKLINLDADSIKIPATKMVELPISAPLKKAVTIIKKSGHSRIPVYEEKEGTKKYTGFLYAKDLLPTLVHREGRFKLSDYVRKHFVVPETQGLLSLLREMRNNKHHLALTVNEHGDVSGLITLEDILEEIVGDIRDEYDSSRRNIREIGHRLYEIDGSTPLTDINKQLALNLPEEKFNTLAGFVLHELKGEFSNDSVVRYGQIILTLIAFSGKEVKKVNIKIPPNNKKVT